MSYPVDPSISFRDRTPVVESEALKLRLGGVVVHASNYGPAGRPVPVLFVNPDTELRGAEYPGIYLSYAGVSKASDREVRGRTNLTYAPSGIDAANVQVPADMDNKDNPATITWDQAGFDRRSSPLHLPEFPLPYNLDFNITVLTRNYQQMMEIISQLQMIDRIPARFGGLTVPQDGTVRTLELMGGPETNPLADEDGKRLLQTVYSVRVTAELSLYDVEAINRVMTVVTDVKSYPYL